MQRLGHFDRGPAGPDPEAGAKPVGSPGTPVPVPSHRPGRGRRPFRGGIHPGMSSRDVEHDRLAEWGLKKQEEKEQKAEAQANEAASQEEIKPENQTAEAKSPVAETEEAINAEQ